MFLCFIILITASFHTPLWVMSEQVQLCNLHCKNASTLDCKALKSEKSGRCCIRQGILDPQLSVSGIDLIHCGLTNVTGFFHNMEHLQQLYLHENMIESISEDDFIGVNSLKKLTLPGNISCPGDVSLWSMVEKTSDVTTCMDELSTCDVFNVTCPNANSYCSDVGPRRTECLCLPGYHGYKCLRKGSFPASSFLVGIFVSTIVLSAVLWFTQRRKVKTL